MNGILRKVVRFLTAEEGPTAVEYAAVLLLILLACLTAITIVGQSTAHSFESSHLSIERAASPGP